MSKDIKSFFQTLNPNSVVPSTNTSDVNQKKVNSRSAKNSADIHSSQEVLGDDDDDDDYPSSSKYPKRNKCVSAAGQKEKILYERSKTAAHRAQNYRKEWEYDEKFANWICPSKESERKAKCKLCNTVMLAKLAVLKKHALDKKHMKLLEKCSIDSINTSVACSLDSIVYSDSSDADKTNENNKISEELNTSLVIKQESFDDPNSDYETHGNDEKVEELEISAPTNNANKTQENDKMKNEMGISAPTNDASQTQENEMVGELGISPPRNNANKTQENDDEMIIEFEISEHSSLKRVKKQNYCIEWENDVKFANWIGPSEESERKAICRLCNKSLSAEIAVLKKHALSRKHNEIVKEISIGSKITSEACSLESVDPSDANKTIENYGMIEVLNTKKASKRNVHRAQNYRKEWENDERFASWLGPSEESETKAMCRICNKTMLAEITVLKRHALSRYHIEIVEDKRADREHENNEGPMIEELMSPVVIIQEIIVDPNNADETLENNQMVDKFNTSALTIIDTNKTHAISQIVATLDNSEVPSEKSSENIVHKAHYYRKEWENDSRFSSWLCPSKESKGKAICRICKKSILADITCVKKHALGQKHLKLSSVYSKSASEAWNQKSSTDPRNAYKAHKNNKFVPELENTVISIKTGNKKNFHRAQNYRKAWEKNVRFASWIGPSKESKRKAICRVCNKSMLAEITVLKKHALGQKHMKLLKYSKSTSEHKNNRMEKELKNCVIISYKSFLGPSNVGQTHEIVQITDESLVDPSIVNQTHEIIEITNESLVDPSIVSQTHETIEIAQESSVDPSIVSRTHETIEIAQESSVDPSIVSQTHETIEIAKESSVDPSIVSQIHEIIEIANKSLVDPSNASQTHEIIEIVNESLVDPSNIVQTHELIEITEELESSELLSQKNHGEISKKKLHRDPNYRIEWENDEMFGSWISPVNGCKRRATCRLCNTIILADFTVLKRHTLSKKHIERAKYDNISSKNTDVACSLETFVETSDADKTLENNMELKASESLSCDKSGKKPVHRAQNYRKEWENDELFASWIAPAKECETKAMCRICFTMMLAEITVLRRHALTQRHIELAKKFSIRSKNNHVPSSLEQFVNLSDPKNTSETNIPALAPSPKKICGDSRKKQNHKAPKYRKEWENDVRLASWIAPSQESKRKAFCRICNVMLLADLTVLKRHPSSQKHMKHIKDVSICSKNTSAVCSLESFVDWSDFDITHKNDQMTAALNLSNLSSKINSDESSRKRIPRVLNYRKEWENDERFASWLGPSEESETRAKCRICNKTMLAEITVLKRHALTRKHIENFEDVNICSRNTSPARCFDDSGEADNAEENNQKIAEFQLATFLSEYSIPVKAAEHLVEVIKSSFSDSQVARSVSFSNLKPYCIDDAYSS